MISNVIMGQYVQRDSIFHSLDPRTKLICIFIFMISIFWVHNFSSYVLAAMIVLACLLLSKIPFKFFINGLRPIFIILIFIFVFHLFSATGGEVIYKYGYLTLYQEGLTEGIKMVIRIILLVLITSLLTLTTKPLDLAHGLERILKPLEITKLPVEQFSLMISITLRFIPTLLSEAEKIIEAQKARGADFEHKNPVKRLYNYIPIIVPLLVASVKRAENLSYAIDARAYGNGRGRTKYQALKYNRTDYMAFSLFSLFFLLLILLSRSH